MTSDPEVERKPRKRLNVGSQLPPLPPNKFDKLNRRDSVGQTTGAKKITDKVIQEMNQKVDLA